MKPEKEEIKTKKVRRKDKGTMEIVSLLIHDLDQILKDDSIELVTHKISPECITKDKVPDENELTHEVRLFLVNEEIYNKIQALSAKANSLKKETRTKHDKDPFYYVCKIINPDGIPAYKYEMKTQEKYLSIKNKEIIQNRMESEFVIFKNKKMKSLEEIEDLEQKEKLKQKVSDEISYAAQMKNYILENFDDLDVVISGYEMRKQRAMIYYTRTKKSPIDNKLSLQEYLRTELPNILYYVDSTKDKNKRADFHQRELLKLYKHGFGTIYFKEKRKK